MEKKKITKEEINRLPPLKFEGESFVIDNGNDLQSAIEDLKKSTILGFDTETKPVFRKGQSRNIALLQLSTSERSYIFQLKKIGFLNELINLLEDENIIKVGIGILDDIRGLQKIKNFQPKNFLDLNKKAEELKFENIGARNLAALLLNGKISKSQQVSNWENDPLTLSQISYACTDAWICIKIFEKMTELTTK